jgi:peroxisomal 3,2-trans-enoyl-CoA isomerase
MAEGAELARSMIDHKKVLVLAMNGPGVGAGATWFQGSSDLFFAAEGSWLHVTFSQLGLIPENGTAYNWSNHIGTHRANEILMLGERVGAEELLKVGMVNKVFPAQGFHDAVQAHLSNLLKDRSGKSMIEMKRLANAPLREKRLVAVFDAWNALAERFVDGEPARRMGAKAKELEGEFGAFLLPFLLFNFVTVTNVRVLTFVNRKAKGKAIEAIGHGSMTLFLSDFN